MALVFEWDDRKAASNVEKHGVSFEEAVSAFGDALSMTVADPEHSHREIRYLLVGATAAGRVVVVAHAERGDNIRIISARPATGRESRDYEQGGFN